MAKGKKTGGRSAGTPNKANSEIRAVLDDLALAKDGKDLHIRKLHDLSQSEDPHVAVKALTLVLAYRHGRPPETVEHSGSVDLRTRVVHEYHAQ